MNPQSRSDDLAYVRQLAEEGATAPSLSGRFSMMWGALVTLAFIAHWSVMAGIMPLPQQWIGLIWVTMAATGLVGGAIIGSTMGNKPGMSAPGNRANRAVWQVVTMGLFLYGAAIGFAVVFREMPFILFDTIIPVAFLTYAMTKAMAATLFRDRSRKPLVYVSLGLLAVSMVFIGRPEVYLIAALGVVLLHVVPGYMEWRAEPKDIV